MRIRVKIWTNKAGSECVDEFDLPDDTSNDALEDIALDAALLMIDWDYEIIEKRI